MARTEYYIIPGGLDSRAGSLDGYGIPKRGYYLRPSAAIDAAYRIANERQAPCHVAKVTHDRQFGTNRMTHLWPVYSPEVSHA